LLLEENRPSLGVHADDQSHEQRISQVLAGPELARNYGGADALAGAPTPFRIFVPHYYSCALPALCLIVAWGFRQVLSSRMRLWVGTCIVIGAMLRFGGLHLQFSPFKDD